MARLTRNSFKRKIILFGVFVFASIALISTGFAAWVLSSDSNKPVDGNVNVGVVEDARLGVEITSKDNEHVQGINAFDFLFEPQINDTEGRLKIDEYDQEGNKYDSTKLVYATLKLVINGTITNPEALAENGFTIKMDVSETLQKGLLQAVQKGYIVAPKCLVLSDGAKSHAQTLGVDVTGFGSQVISKQSALNEGVDFQYYQDGDTWKFRCVVEFKWGATFGGKNPSIYFDEDAKANPESPTYESDDNVKAMLEELRACVYGYYDALVATATKEARQAVIDSHASDALPEYKITISAVAR